MTKAFLYLFLLTLFNSQYLMALSPQSKHLKNISLETIVYDIEHLKRMQGNLEKLGYAKSQDDASSSIWNMQFTVSHAYYILESIKSKYVFPNKILSDIKKLETFVTMWNNPKTNKLEIEQSSPPSRRPKFTLKYLEPEREAKDAIYLVLNMIPTLIEVIEGHKQFEKQSLINSSS